jgi:hypothetical protein
LISAREMVSARPPLLFSSPAAGHLLPPGLAQSVHRYLSVLSTTELVRFGRLSLTGGPTMSVSLTVFFLRKPDRAPPPSPPHPRSPAAPTPTPPLPWQNESASLFLFPDSPFRLPMSSPPETALPLKFHRAVAGYSSTARLRSSPALKNHPRAPSPHHGPGPRIDSLHPRPCCPPTSSTHRHLHSSTSGHHRRRTTPICLR